MAQAQNRDYSVSGELRSPAESGEYDLVKSGLLVHKGTETGGHFFKDIAVTPKLAVSDSKL